MQRGGTETILLLEDEEMVRSLARRILKDQGYSVLEAGNGDEAIQTAGQYSGTIHLLLTDVVLPGDSGLTVATRLHDVRPDMRVLYVSGYTKDMNSLERILEAGAPFLSKPFTPDMLTRKVRETLDGGHGGVRN
jgi:DNA-binding response OmpR family regulator